MNNYDAMQEAARLRFLQYDFAELLRKPGVADGGDHLQTCFLGQQVSIQKRDGAIKLDGRPASFGESLALYDWLCDGKADAAAAGEYCAVGSLPGVLVSGSGLVIAGDQLAGKINRMPDAFVAACESLGGKAVSLGDLGYCVPLFPGLCGCVKFYFADEEFPPSLTLLWDKNILQFVRYETVYYIAGCLQQRLLQLMGN